MEKNSMQDIVPKGKRSIRNIPLLHKKNEEETVEVESVEIVESKDETFEDVRQEFEYSNQNRRNRNKKIRFAWIAGGIVVVLGLVILTMNFFKSATITITTRTASAVVQKDYSNIPFQIVTATTTESLDVNATGQKQVDTKASGTIVIFNNYSSASQRLIKNTRFETPEGLIYRIPDSVTVPGKSSTTPGSVETTVIADESGAKYNVGLKDFTIPGFKGDPRYSSFYARSKTPLAGGFSGIQKVIADSDRKSAQMDIEAKLSTELLKQIELSKSADYVFFDKAYSIDFTKLPDDISSGSNVSIKEQGVISAVFFDKKILSSAIAKDYIQNYNNEPILITNIEEMVFSPKGVFHPTTNNDSISFNISGDAKFEWVYDELSLKQALEGQDRSNVASILQKFPMIQKADVSVSPFWTSILPTSLDKIILNNQNN